MFFDIGWPELMLIGVVALVVIGPKDLPRALRVAGMFVRKARTLSREFQNSVDQMIREAELEEMREELKKATEFDVEREIRNTVDPQGELAESLKSPAIPDYFDDAPAAPAAVEAAPEPALLEAPAESPLPEQPALPFDDLDLAPPESVPAKVASEPDFTPPKP